MNPSDIAIITSALPTAPTPGTDPAKAASQVFARILVREVQRSLPEGGLLGGSEFAPLEALITDALVAQLSDGDHLGLASMFERGLPTSATHAPGGTALVDGGRLTSDFGMRSHPIHHRMQHHDGIDIAAPRGAPIRAARAGVVRESRAVEGYGNLVVIDHGRGLQTRYAHCDQLLVHPGNRVEAGAQIATVGDSGNATGPHLHFEVRRDGIPIDPAQMTGEAKVDPGTADDPDADTRKLRYP